MVTGVLDQMMRAGLRDCVFPGAVLLVGKGDRPLFFEAFGRANLFSGQKMTRSTVFDLASLTKPLATTLAVAKLVDEQKITLDDPVGRWFSSFADGDKAPITVRQLLGHQSGLPAHRRFYMSLKNFAPRMRKPAVLDLIKSIPLAYRPGEKRLYSDLGFMVLCRLVEVVGGRSMDRFLASEIYGPAGAGDLFFVDLLDGKKPDRAFAATELCPIRNRLLIGEVHDDNAWWAGGVDGHAGLFGTAGAVFQLIRKLLDCLAGGATSSLLSQRTMSEFVHGTGTESFPLGFDRPDAINSSAGRHFSANTIGHLGFTGVSFWADLNRDFTVILLTNRVHPSRWNHRLLSFRPRLHDRILEHFEIVSD